MRQLTHWRQLAACSLAAALLGSSPVALGGDTDQDRPRGAQGPGMMHDGGGYGPGMMRGGGPGYGPGTRPGYDNGYGRGYENGYGPGYGMMPGYGPGMMQGYGPMHGPGMMPGYGPRMGDQDQRYPRELTDEQRQRLQRIQREHQERNWELMDQMREEQRQLYRLEQDATPDWDEIEKSTRRMGELRQQMIERRLQTQRRMHEVLQEE